MQNITKKINKELKIKIIIFLAFFLLSFYLTATHQPWRDEAQAWLIARDSDGLSGLFQLMGYEGTPALWHLILLPFAKLGFPFQTVFVIHFLLNLFAIFLLVFISPFKTYQIVLICFGYYALIEYNIIARSYILSFIGLEIIAIYYLIKNSKYRFALIALGFFILSWSNILGTVASIIIFLYLILINKSQFTKKNLIKILITFLLINLLIIPQLIPPSDLGPHGGLNFKISFSSINNLLFSFSNSFIGNLLSFIPQESLTRSVQLWLYPLSFIIIGLLCCFSLIKKTRSLLLFLIISISELALFQVKEIGGTAYRHCGIIFLSYIFILWLFNTEKYTKHKFINLIPSLLSTLSIIILLSLGSLSSIFTIIKLNSTPLSNANKTYQYLKDNQYTDNSYFIGGFSCFSLEVITANMPNNIKIFAADYGEYQTYVKWDTKYIKGIKKSTNENIATYLQEFNSTPYKKGILLVNREHNNDSLIKSFGFTKLSQFYGALVYSEDFDIWLIQK